MELELMILAPQLLINLFQTKASGESKGCVEQESSCLLVAAHPSMHGSVTFQDDMQTHILALVRSNSVTPPRLPASKNIGSTYHLIA